MTLLNRSVDRHGIGSEAEVPWRLLKFFIHSSPFRRALGSRGQAQGAALVRLASSITDAARGLSRNALVWLRIATQIGVCYAPGDA
jgi:hypothetical protein